MKSKEMILREDLGKEKLCESALKFSRTKFANKQHIAGRQIKIIYLGGQFLVWFFKYPNIKEIIYEVGNLE